jgi:diadenosine tetraphosphatase ApaH/serine/threonine PP2A family protein phosphatase
MFADDMVFALADWQLRQQGASRVHECPRHGGEPRDFEHARREDGEPSQSAAVGAPSRHDQSVEPLRTFASARALIFGVRGYMCSPIARTECGDIGRERARIPWADAFRCRPEARRAARGARGPPFLPGGRASAVASDASSPRQGAHLYCLFYCLAHADSPSVTIHHSCVTASSRSREWAPYRACEQQRLAPD